MYVSISNVATCATVNLNGFTWFRYKGLRSVKIQCKAGVLLLAPDTIYGVKTYTSKQDRVVLRSDLSTVYLLDVPSSDKVMKKSSEFKGKIPGTVATAPKPNKAAVSKLKMKPKPMPISKVKVDLSKDIEETDDFGYAPDDRLVAVQDVDDDFDDVSPYMPTRSGGHE
jgi:hypothetical protein